MQKRNDCVLIIHKQLISKQISFPYKLGDTLLEHVNIVKDLGVLFETDMSFRQHIDDIVCKANRILGFIWRNTKDINNVTVFTTLFRSLVLSKLEYCSSVWSPSQANLINKIERVQKRAVKYMAYKQRLSYCNVFYIDLCSKFQLQPL